MQPDAFQTKQNSKEKKIRQEEGGFILIQAAQLRYPEKHNFQSCSVRNTRGTERRSNSQLLLIRFSLCIKLCQRVTQIISFNTHSNGIKSCTTANCFSDEDTEAQTATEAGIRRAGTWAQPMLMEIMAFSLLELQQETNISLWDFD